jgi:hypothetical protein
MVVNVNGERESSAYQSSRKLFFVTHAVALPHGTNARSTAMFFSVLTKLVLEHSLFEAPPFHCFSAGQY